MSLSVGDVVDLEVRRFLDCDVDLSTLVTRDRALGVESAVPHLRSTLPTSRAFCGA
jgi:hypothetical protein